MKMHTVKRLAADLMKTGRNKVRIKPENIKEAEAAMTRADLTKLINDGTIFRAKEGGRTKTERRKRRGAGRKRGSALINAKKEWMRRVRSQRRLLRKLLEDKALKHADKTAIYMKIKSGLFKSKNALLAYLKENEYMDKKYVIEKGGKK